MRLLLVLCALLVACTRDGSSELPDAAPDGPDGVGCAPLTPRSVEPQAFIGPDGLEARLGTLIDSAQHTLDLQMYLFTVDALATKLVAAKQRGVAVRIILDPDEAGNASVEPAFRSASVPFRMASSIYAYSHAKYLVIVGPAAVIMSMNFNDGAMRNERNYGIVDRDLEDVADTAAIFTQDWALAGGEPPKPANLTCTRLIVSPDNAKPRLLTHINNAMSTLEVEALYVTDVNVRNAIGAAKQRGVNVRVILEDPSDQATNADTTTYLKGLGIPVHYVTTQFYLHAKLITADGVAFVGSENFSVSGLTKNRELGALVFEPTAAAVMKTQFEADWAATPTAP